MNPHILAQLKHFIAGEVVDPSHSAYDQARNVFNQTGQPAVIVRAQNTEDVVTTIRFACEYDKPLSIRSGGHGFSGLSTNNDGLVLDLSQFNQIELLDPTQHLVRIGTGAHWGDVAKTLATHGLALSSGDTNQVGVGGLTLGGGIGWMVRTHGLLIDSLQAAQIVTADGRVLRVSTDEHPDLFWAIRGGGGNFGVVTSFDFQAQSYSSVIGGTITYPASDAETVLNAWSSFMREAPDTLNSTIVLFSGLGSQVPANVMVQICYAGDDEVAASKAIEPFLHLGTVLKQDLKKQPYYTMLVDAISPPPGMRLAGHNGFLKTLNREAVSLLAENYGQPGKPFAQIRSLGGAMARVAPEATAFAHRENDVLVIVPTFAPQQASTEQTHHIRQAAWKPLEALTNGAFLNFLTDASDASVSATYPDATYTRLASIKAIYDPHNVFNQNQNIKPTTNPIKL